jgi:hypothetical protein
VLFKLSSPDPVSSLKQFMHDQFEAEIEAGRKSEMQEETVSIQFAHEAVADEMKSNRVETMKTAQGIEPPALIKRGLYPYVISASLVIVIIAAALMFWPGKPEKTMSPVPVQPTVNTVGQSKSVTQIESGTKTESGTTTDKQQREMQKDVPEEQIGGLTINAIPWANVYINGKARGTTPQTLEDLKAGTYKVRLQNPDFPVWETKIRISKGKTAKVSHRFVSFGKIIINATPWADVYLDGTLKGQTPLTIEKVSAGKHQIKVSREGFTGYSKTFEMSEGVTKRFSATLKKEG